MQPSLDQLIQITRTLAHDDDFVRVVLASTQGDVQGDVQFIAHIHLDQALLIVRAKEEEFLMGSTAAFP